MQYNLNRFVEAQSQFGIFDIALSEMEAGRKRNHWIWYIFPQLKGFGHSYNSKYYGLADLAEAKEYLSHPILGSRLREITNQLLAHNGVNIRIIMGSNIDAIKLRSSMTLFDFISPNDVFGKCLDIFFDGKRDDRTIERII